MMRITRKKTQRSIARELGLPQSFFCHILKGERRPSPKNASHLEMVSGIERMIWLYGKPHELRREIEKVYGEINFQRGRPPEKEMENTNE